MQNKRLVLTTDLISDFLPKSHSQRSHLLEDEGTRTAKMQTYFPGFWTVEVFLGVELWREGHPSKQKRGKPGSWSCLVVLVLNVIYSDKFLWEH